MNFGHINEKIIKIGNLMFGNKILYIHRYKGNNTIEPALKGSVS
jgi:hypothetical protein